ncbi:MAG TPA: PCYCGC motif-containing (lipo)protein [Vicinamibacterales bacterium]|jgi:hypothetical protein|nr:PCYCGC motif-containing (lipo)protein [Vicinamibacterales bacterium]
MIEKRIILPMLIAGLTAVLAAQSAAPAAPRAAKLAPHPQANLPALHLPDIDARLLPRPPEVIRATYRFAAEHPEVLGYVPCFCGCDQSGHRSSEDCFVKARAKNGDVTEWNEHGIACAMCLAVAERAKQMCEKGASLKDVRADVEERYGHITGSRTATPLPPKP